MFLIYVFLDVAYFFYFFYLEIKFKNAPTKFKGYKKNPIVLVQGVGNSWTALIKLGGFLNQIGYPVYYVPQLGFSHTPIPESAQIVKNLIEKENLKNVVIFGHSKGGLIAKYFLIHLNSGGRVLGAVSFATPYQGSYLANLTLFKSHREFRTGNPIMIEMGKEKTLNKKVISIIPSFDTVVWGKNKSYLDSALDNVVIKTGGHIYPIFSEELFNAVEKSIEKLIASG